MLAARVEQKNQQTRARGRHNMVFTTLDNDSAKQAPSLTLAARDGDGQYAVGAEECSRRGSNKRINKQGREGATKWCAPPLTKVAPCKRAPYKPCARIGLARICAGCALQAR